MKNALGPFLLICTVTLTLMSGLMPGLDGKKKPSEDNNPPKNESAAAPSVQSPSGSGSGTGAGTGAGTGFTATGTYPGGKAGNGKEFTPEMKAFAMQMAEKYGLTNLSPSDAMKYFGHEGPASAEEWAGLMARMVNVESGFDPNNTYYETYINSAGQRVPALNDKGEQMISRGLFQLSEGDLPGLTVADCYDPYKNMETAVKIMARDIGKAGVINGRAEGQGNTGLAAYWGPFRTGVL